MVERWPVATREPVLHLAWEYIHLEAQFGQQPAKEAVVLIAEASSAMVHDLVVQKWEVELDSNPAVHREVLKRHRQEVAGVQLPHHLQAGLRGARKPDAS